MIKQSGQTLIEVMVVFLVATIVFGALAVAILSSMKNAQFAQKQTQATKYAQEAMEQIKIIRDNNGPVIFDHGGTPTTNFGELWGFQMSADCGLPSTACPMSLSLDNTQLSGPVSPPTQTLREGFTRQITFDDQTSQYEKWVTVRVKWSDSAGEHESKLKTILTQH